MSDKHSDDELEKLIKDLHYLAEGALKLALEKNNEVKKISKQ